MKRNQTMYFSSRRVWLLLFALLLVCAGILLWLFYGTFETTAVCRGVFATKENCVTLHQRYTGVVTDIYCAKNSYVDKGDMILAVYPCGEEKPSLPLETLRQHSIDVSSEISGYVADIIVKEWDRVSLETPILKMMHSDYRDLDVVITAVSVDSSAMRDLAPGETTARIYPKTTSPEENGYISGTVIGVASLAEGFEEIYDIVGNKNAARFLAEGGQNGGETRPVYLVYVMVETDNDTHEAIFSRRQPKKRLRPFDECSVILLLDKNRPYERIFSHGRAK